MSKFRKTLKKKVNPTKSNRLIIAVGVGSMIIFVTLFLLVLNPGSPANKAEAMDNALKYLKKDEGILSIKSYPEQNRAVIVYDSSKKDKDKNPRDYVPIARFAGIRLSYEMGDLKITLILQKIEKNSRFVNLC